MHHKVSSKLCVCKSWRGSLLVTYCKVNYHKVQQYLDDENATTPPTPAESHKVRENFVKKPSDKPDRRGLLLADIPKSKRTLFEGWHGIFFSNHIGRYHSNSTTLIEEEEYIWSTQLSNVLVRIIKSLRYSLFRRPNFSSIA